MFRGYCCSAGVGLLLNIMCTLGGILAAKELSYTHIRLEYTIETPGLSIHYMQDTENHGFLEPERLT